MFLVPTKHQLPQVLKFQKASNHFLHIKFWNRPSFLRTQTIFQLKAWPSFETKKPKPNGPKPPICCQGFAKSKDPLAAKNLYREMRAERVPFGTPNDTGPRWHEKRRNNFGFKDVQRLVWGFWWSDFWGCSNLRPSFERMAIWYSFSCFLKAIEPQLNHSWTTTKPQQNTKMLFFVVFFRRPSCNVVVFNSLIDACVRACDLQGAGEATLRLFYRFFLVQRC